MKPLWTTTWQKLRVRSGGMLTSVNLDLTSWMLILQFWCYTCSFPGTGEEKLTGSELTGQQMKNATDFKMRGANWSERRGCTIAGECSLGREAGGKKARVRRQERTWRRQRGGRVCLCVVVVPKIKVNVSGCVDTCWHIRQANENTASRSSSLLCIVTTIVWKQRVAVVAQQWQWNRCKNE